MNLSYSDIVLIPQYSKVISRSDITTDVTLGNKTFKLPFVPANMKCVIDWVRAGELSRNGYFYIMHRFDDYSETIKTVKHLNTIPQALISISVGIKDKDYDLIKFIKVNHLRVDYITVDVAHGHAEGVKNMIQHIKKELPSVFVIAGNIITVDAAKDLAEWGADAVKVGIGGGFACTTADKTGYTSNMFSTINAIHTALNNAITYGYKVPQVSLLYNNEAIKAGQNDIPLHVISDLENTKKPAKKRLEQIANAVESTNYVQVVQPTKKKTYIIA